MSAKASPEWQAKLESLESAVVALIEPPLKLSEVFGFVEGLGGVVTELSDDLSYDAVLSDLQAAWEYLDGKHEIIRKLDDAIKAGIAEPFDGPAMRWVVEKVCLPWTAKAIAKLG